ncbi:MAG: hypothetical protein ACRDY2_05395 [Acidimicrobiales bacterium]
MGATGRRWPKRAWALLFGALCATGLAACGGGSSPAAATTTTTTAPASTRTSTPGLPGASGTIAAISGSTLEVQNPSSGQVSVILTKST